MFASNFTAILLLIFLVTTNMYAGAHMLQYVADARSTHLDLRPANTRASIFRRDWCYTTNHKKLGFLYFCFAGLSGLFGTTLAATIRMELSQPGSHLLNGCAGSFHILVAIHAILMVFFVVTPVVFGGFGNYFLPTQVGARDVAYPRLNNFSV